MKEAIDAIVASSSDQPAPTGLVVGVMQQGAASVFGYGRLSEASGQPPPGDTIFEIGSVTKLFTSALLAILVAEGLVRLEDPVRELAAELAGMPLQLTLLRLATHTGGLPRMPSNMIRSMLRDPGNPSAAYTTEDLFHYLSKHKPAPDRLAAGQVRYSNVGMALLGTLLARKAGGAYEQVLHSRICVPLGLRDTTIRLSPDQQRRLAPPHSAGGKPGRNWDLPAFAGAGALRSTADDLLAFLAANMGSPASDLTAPLQACHAVRAEDFAPPGRLQRWAARLPPRAGEHRHHREAMALGWTVGRLPSGGGRVHWHHGGTGGYRAFAGFIQESRTGAVVLANSGLARRDALSGTTSTDQIGFAILEHLHSAA